MELNYGGNILWLQTAVVILEICKSVDRHIVNQAGLIEATIIREYTKVKGYKTIFNCCPMALLREFECTEKCIKTWLMVSYIGLTI